MEQEIDNLKRQLAQMQNTLEAQQNMSQFHSVQSAMNPLPSPEVFSFEKEEWPAWIKHYESQINNLLIFMGPRVLKLFETQQKQKSDFTSYQQLKEFLDNQFIGTKNIVYARAKFNMRSQKEGEPAHGYISDLVSLAKSCDFKTLVDDQGPSSGWY